MMDAEALGGRKQGVVVGGLSNLLDSRTVLLAPSVISGPARPPQERQQK